MIGDDMTCELLDKFGNNAKSKESDSIKFILKSCAWRCLASSSDQKGQQSQLLLPAGFQKHTSRIEQRIGVVQFLSFSGLQNAVVLMKKLLLTAGCIFLLTRWQLFIA